ncbi:M6 family metalloprotease domain-containing protein [Motilimonas sp. KMU-193]|uniref:M6 family metalloprotease domain-containing protein n=1 Tax=Motilimonas sp. KMU-193 TaxID=3388668 RepID=UPI00396B2769
MKTIKLLSLATLLTVSTSMAATPPAPVSHTITLADGSEQRVNIRGGFGQHWYQTDQGAAIMRDPNNSNNWFYASLTQVQGDSGSTHAQLTISDIPVSASSAAPASSYITAAPRLAQPRFDKTVTTTLPNRPLQRNVRHFNKPSLARTSVTSQPLLVVQVSFTDQVMAHDFSQLVFGREGQSTVDYFLANSANQYHVVPAKETAGIVDDGIIDVSLSQTHPNCNDQLFCRSRLASAFEEAYQHIDPYIDLAQYDNNQDGEISPDELAVMFVFAGNDMSSSILTPAIWPHKSSHPAITLDQVSISEYCLFGDFQNDHQSTLGVIVHELGHLMLGLPDLYSYYDRGSIGEWGLMGAGSWTQKPGDLYAGETPVNMTAWSKQAAGFLTPRVLDKSGQYQLDTDHDSAIVYLDPYLKTAGPRLYIENRRKQGYDQGLISEGVLITSVDIRQPFNDSSPMQVQVMQADNRNHLGFDNGQSDAGDLYPGSSQNQLLSDNSAPSLISVYGGDTGIEISQIQSAPQQASFTLTLPDNANKSAWLTQLERGYVYRNHGLNNIAFAIDISETFDQMVGFNYFVYPTALAGIHLTLSHYPNHANGLTLDLNPQTPQVLWQGAADLQQGRIILPEPISLPRGKGILLLEVLGGELEINPVFSSDYSSRLYDLAPSWIGTTAEREAGNLLNYGYLNVPFAALLEANESHFVQAQADAYQLDEDTQLTLNLVANDLIQLGYPMQGIELVYPPQLGQFDITSGLYQPHANVHGTDTFSYRVVLANGVKSSPVPVTVTINAVNDEPTAQSDSFEQADSNLALLDVLANDLDIDGDTLNITRIVTAPTHGQARIVNNQIEFDSHLTHALAPNAQLSDQFSYEISDGQGGFSTAQAQVIIKGPKPTPVPTPEPTPVPSIEPTPVPTPVPTAEPTVTPSTAPSDATEPTEQTNTKTSSSSGGGGSLTWFSLMALLGLVISRRKVNN